MRFHLLTVGFKPCAIQIQARKSFPVSMSSSLFLKFSSVIFTVFCLMLTPLVHLELSFVQSNRYRYRSVFFSSACSLYAVWLDAVFFQCVFLGFFVKKKKIRRKRETKKKSFSWCVYLFVHFQCLWFYANAMLFLLL